MVNQVPGFLLDDGNSNRGFAASAGNILVNDRRPSAKRDLPSAILVRIPASRVERIEVIRGQVRDIDLQGQAVVANVILVDAEEAAIRWRAYVRYNVKHGVTSDVGISLSNRWRGVEYNTGLQLRRFPRGDLTTQAVLDGNGMLSEKRIDTGDFLGHRGSLNLNAATYVGETFVRLNTRIGGETLDGARISQRTPQAPGTPPREEHFPEDWEILNIEVGLDGERNLHPGLLGKAILLHIDQDRKSISSQVSLDNEGGLTRERISDTDTASAETIVRIELNWTGWSGHAVQANAEGALNTLDNSLLQTVDTGAGAEIIDVPGSNSRVEEIRGDFLLKDTWSLGHFELEYGLGAEVSTIEQTGDAELKRDFSFLKPQAAITYAPHQGEQTRFSLARDVSQLDFNDFVSATVFEDDDLALGNPDLRPETTWRLELSHERRFGKDGVTKLSAFHDWVSDVEDLLPLTPTFEAPGNIGDGRRWGFELESTLPLERLGLKGAKLDINARWQDSSVVDPVTGHDRVFSVRSAGGRLLPLIYRVENEYAITVNFRQDFEAARIAWGWEMRARGERPFFKVNELDVSDEGAEVNTFIETTRWFDTKIRFGAENILDLVETRDRTAFVGERDLSTVDFRELRSRTRGFRVALDVSGSF